MFKAIHILTLLYLVKYIEGLYGVDFYGSDDELATIESTDEGITEITETPAAAGPSRNRWLGYQYYPKIQGWLKLHTEPVDWHTARMNCHDDDAVLATPWDSNMESVLQNFLTDGIYSMKPIPEAIYVGIQKNYPEGVYVSKNGKPVISEDPSNIDKIDNCGAYNSYSTEMTWVDCQRRLAYVCHAMSPCGDDLGYELKERTGQCYKFHSQPRAWNDAHATCLDEKAHLAIVNSYDEAQVLANIIQDPPNINIANDYDHVTVGFYYWKQAEKYVTIFGQTLEQAGYAEWENNNQFSRDESNILGGAMRKNGKFIYVNKYSLLGFICEKKPILLKISQ